MFDFGKNTFIGIDVGTSAIKIAEIKVEDGKPTLSNYAWAPLKDAERINEANPEYFEAIISAYLKKITKEASIKGRRASIAIPSFGGFITLIDFPEVSETDLGQAVRYEAQKYIPTSLDEVVLSWDLIKKENDGAIGEIQASGSGNSKVLLVAAPKNKVGLYEKIITSSGLKLAAIEIESFPLVTALVGTDLGRFVIVDIGSRVCNIILVDKGVIRANRNLDAGGRDITRIISKSMGLDDKRAEAMKISGKNFFSPESGIKFPTLDLIAGEVSRMIDVYSKKEGAGKIESVILSGGTAGLFGINEYFSGNLGIKTVSGNPFGRIKYDSRLQIQIDKMKSRFSVCIGLALREAENSLKEKNKKFLN